MATRLAHSASAPPQFYFDEKWKLSKKEGSSRSGRSSTAPLMKNSSSQRRCSFTRKCARLVKEQRARFYIMRRCVSMLICWRDYSDSWKGKKKIKGEIHHKEKRDREQIFFKKDWILGSSFFSLSVFLVLASFLDFSVFLWNGFLSFACTNTFKKKK